MKPFDAKPLAAGALLVAAALASYLPLFTMPAGFIWDDDAYVTGNATLRSAAGLRDIWLHPGATPQYYPLVFTSFWLEYRLWGLDPIGYHAVNVLLHALNVLLLWRILKRLGLPGAFLAAAVFAVHPVHVESVAWITERKNVLSGAFYFAALLAALGPAGLAEEGGGVRARRFPAPVWFLFLGALLSKTVTATLPVAILLLVWMKRGRVERRDAVQVLPMVLLGALFGGVTAWIEKYGVGAAGAAWSLSPVERVLVAGRALWFYAFKLAWPANLTFIYPRWTLDASSARLYLFPAAALAAGAALWALRARLGRAPLVAALFFAATLFPALGFLDVYPFRYSFVADHFQYLASVGPIALVCGAGAFAAGRLGESGRRAGLAISGVMLAALSFASARQCSIYKDVETLWRDTLAGNPNSWLAHNNLGELLYSRGDVDGALAHLRAAVAASPDYPEAQFNLGVALARKGRVDEAERCLARAIELEPGYAKAHQQLGVFLMERGRVDEALGHLRTAVVLEPGRAWFHWNLAVAFSRVGKLDEGLEQVREAVRLAPLDPVLRAHLGSALEKMGQLAEAAARFDEALRIDPTNAEARAGALRCGAAAGSEARERRAGRADTRSQ